MEIYYRKPQAEWYFLSIHKVDEFDFTSKKEIMWNFCAKGCFRNDLPRKEARCKVSISVILISWCLMFFLSMFMSPGRSYQDAGAIAEVIGKKTWHKIQTGKSLNSGDLLTCEDHDTYCSDEESDISSTINENLVVPAKGHLLVDENGTTQSPTGLQMKRSSDLGVKKVNNSVVNNKLFLGLPPTFDEFKNKAIMAKEKPVAGQGGGVIHRLEPGGKEYNYASALRGSKVLASNKEAKGASNILVKDKNQYLRNPCSAVKHLIIELSEETLVATIEMANFEHYSSNLKDFELFTSLIYPTENWDHSGNFTAANMKHEQRFDLQEPRWARYLKINILSHYGSEFYCTLSLLEVYGVDAVEKMLEDLISNQECHDAQESASQLPSNASTESDINKQILTGLNHISEQEYTTKETPKSNADSACEARASQVGRMPGDTVLKILMQKVRLLDVNLAALEKYLDGLNGRYGQLLKDFDEHKSSKNSALQHLAAEIKNLCNSSHELRKDIEDLLGWKPTISSQLERLILDNLALRSQVEAIRINQAELENKRYAVVFILFIFCFSAAFKLVVDALLRVGLKHDESVDHICSPSSRAWFLILLSSGMVMSILVL